MNTKLERIMEIVREAKGTKVQNVMYLLGEKSNLIGCFNELKTDKATGVDGVDLEEYRRDLETNLDGLIERMKKWQYRPQPARRTYIEKSNGKRRPLGIPTTEDKIVQQGVKKILEAVYEPEFLESSYGFRKGKGCHQALEKLDGTIRSGRINYIIDADIKGFFDNVNQKWLIKFIGHRIEDKSLLRLLVRILRSGVMEAGRWSASEKGTPQGGIVSPVLANIYLHYVLDLWIEHRIKKQMKGRVEIVRYADDFVIGVEHEEEATELLAQMKKRLSEFGLELAEEKTKIIPFGRKAKKDETFNFLGFTHYNRKTRRGQYKVGRKTDRNRMSRALKAANEWLKEIRNALPVQEWWKTLGAKMRGHFQYYGVSGNSRSIGHFHYRVIRLTWKWINRRSQKRSLNWTEWWQYLERHPLPTPKIHRCFA